MSRYVKARSAINRSQFFFREKLKISSAFWCQLVCNLGTNDWLSFLRGGGVPNLGRWWLQDPVPGGVVQPRVLVGATHAGVHPDRLAAKFVCWKLAAVRHQTISPRARRALLLPWSIVLGRIDGDRVLNPLDNLGHGDEVCLWMTL